MSNAGAEVYVLSHTPSKEPDAMKMGADHFIDTNQKEWYKPYNVRYVMLEACQGDLTWNSTDVLSSSHSISSSIAPM